jgi:molybdopterin converting factor subunit 1
VTVNVKLFAIVKERAGVGELSLELGEGATVAAAGRAIVERFAVLKDIEPRVAYAVNREYANRETVLCDGDELALIPPVSGGCA